MSDSKALILLLDPLPFRRAAYARQLNIWALPNGFTVQEASALQSESGPTPALTLIVLGSQSLGSSQGRRGVEAVIHLSDGPVAVLVDIQSVECTNVALDLGLHGVLNVAEPPEVLSAALGFIIAGGRYVPHLHPINGIPSQRSYLPQPVESSRKTAHLFEPEAINTPDLTRRQYEVLEGLANGHSNKEIARSLDLSEATVKSHVRQVMRKLDVDNRTQAALLARDFLASSSGNASGDPKGAYASNVSMDLP
ncbi:response regulator transcription factor [Sulfitobacter sp. KE34]|uniref:helix-turn-helix transcriptional regulator n=1 Tax=unclassified Sulfitobacter TaxID=196795 RepID=UPI0023E195FA|nr:MULTISPECIES: response regulator transcription factor [unclassified Sulfitobacter]MDF3351808.1 response regulator transcription factor [Sulfitobacter sp. KE12]MDF3355480.1 response regulator transcription factor [Sulfitobacter sp. KE27]MDF3359128.1 response regulator transcription factor [Sulfitobacter sp. KE33]MDF3366552.1 response regulator transcription factor [Sulfitobacter sp. Ks34]MDF3370161.1 response regulator transcription factor [Sulfitobacter sp. Ks43]